MPGGHVTHAEGRQVPACESEDQMTKIVNCECGQTVRAEDEDELVAKVEAHVASDHPELVGKLTREAIVAMAKEA